MIQLSISMTSRGFSKNDRWQTYNEETKTFENMKAAKDWLKETYKGHKRVPMYHDLPGGKAEKCGWIYSFKNYQYRNGGERVHFIEQHWVGFYLLQPINPAGRD